MSDRRSRAPARLPQRAVRQSMALAVIGLKLVAFETAGNRSEQEAAVGASGVPVSFQTSSGRGGWSTRPTLLLAKGALRPSETVTRWDGNYG